MKTVLVTDDSALIRRQIRDILEPAGYRVIEAENGTEAIDRARAEKPDLIISDLIMPIMDGFDVCRMLKKMPDTSGIPVIIVTGRTSTADIKAGLEAGAVDYITKPFDAVELVGRSASAIKIKEFADQIAILKKKLKVLSTTDDLTGLRNAGYFWEYLSREITKSTAKKTPLSLLVIDIDNFKSINDVFGHLFGDYVLRETAHILADAVGRKGLLARFGGEEFVVVLRNADDLRAVTVAERMRQRLSARKFTQDDRSFRLSLSCGTATIEPDTPLIDRKPVDFFERADRALYEAKMGGKGITVKAMPPGSRKPFGAGR